MIGVVDCATRAEAIRLARSEVASTVPRRASVVRVAAGYQVRIYEDGDPLPAVWRVLPD